MRSDLVNQTASVMTTFDRQLILVMKWLLDAYELVQYANDLGV